MFCTNKFFFTGFYCVGLGARLVVESQGGSPPCKVFRLYIKWSLVFKHFLCWGGGGNVTFGVYAVPLSFSDARTAF